jgi:hypothetical protein
MKYAYQRDGQPLVYWGTGPSVPRQTRAADSVALGSLGGSTLDGPTLELPVPGGPEPILSGVGGCSCSGSCGCGTPLAGIVDSVPGGYVTLAAVAFLAWHLTKRRRR